MYCCCSLDQIPGTDLSHPRNCFRYLHLFFWGELCSAAKRSIYGWPAARAYQTIRRDCKECEPDISHFHLLDTGANVRMCQSCRVVFLWEVLSSLPHSATVFGELPCVFVCLGSREVHGMTLAFSRRCNEGLMGKTLKLAELIGEKEPKAPNPGCFWSMFVCLIFNTCIIIILNRCWWQLRSSLNPGWRWWCR